MYVSALLISALLVGSGFAATINKVSKTGNPDNTKSQSATDTKPTVVVDASNPKERFLFPFGLGGFGFPFGGLGLGGFGGFSRLGFGGLGGFGFPGLFWDESQDNEPAVSQDESLTENQDNEPIISEDESLTENQDTEPTVSEDEGTSDTTADEDHHTDSTLDSGKTIRMSGDKIKKLIVKLRGESGNLETEVQKNQFIIVPIKSSDETV